MQRLVDLLPEFARQVEENLRAIHMFDLADQIALVEVERWTYSRLEEAGSIYVKPTFARNAEQPSKINPRYSHSEELENVPGWVIVDIDWSGRLTGIEIFERADIFDELASRAPELGTSKSG